MTKFVLKESKKIPSFADVEALDNNDWEEFQINVNQSLRDVRETLECLTTDEFEQELESKTTMRERHKFRKMHENKKKLHMRKHVCHNII